MSQADKDHEQWQKKNQERQYREWIKATETGTPYYINQNGDVITEERKEKND